MSNPNPSTSPRSLARWLMAGACGVLTLGVAISALGRSFEPGNAPVGYVDLMGNRVAPDTELLHKTSHSPVNPAKAAAVRSADEPASPAGAPGTSASVSLRTTKSSAEFAHAAPDRMLMTVTAYCPCKICCGKDARGITASGKKITYNRGRFVAADTSVLPFGTRLRVPGYACERVVEVVDRGGSIDGPELDVFFKTHDRALEWGRQKVWVEIVK